MNFLIYNILLGIMAEENVCPICFEGGSEDDSFDYFLPCTHRFHDNCINPWLNDKNTTCPVCRTSIFATAPGEEPYPGLNVNPNQDPNQGLYPGEYVFNPNAIVDLVNDAALFNMVDNVFNSNIAREISHNLNIINLNNEIRNRITDLRIFYSDINNIVDRLDNLLDNPPDEQRYIQPDNINDPHAPDDSDDPEIPDVIN